jgi:hypothetical protein
LPNKNEKDKPQDKNKVMDESMQRAYSKVSKEMPGVKKISVSPSSSSMLSKIFTPRGANAVSNPWSGNMIYNPEMMGGMDQFDKEQVIAHEMTHTKQMQDMPWYQKIGEMLFNRGNVPEGIPATSNLNNPYYWRSHELEAYQTERDRARRLKTPNYVDPITGGRDYALHPKYTPPKVETGPSSAALKKLQGAKK